MFDVCTGTNQVSHLCPRFDFIWLWLYVLVNDFPVIPRQGHRFLCIKMFCYLKGHYRANVDIEPMTSRTGVRQFTTRPTCYLITLREENCVTFSLHRDTNSENFDSEKIMLILWHCVKLWCISSSLGLASLSGETLSQCPISI